jgi:hypothetical protein
MFGEQKRLNLTRFAKQKAAERLSGDDGCIEAAWNFKQIKRLLTCVFQNQS